MQAAWAPSQISMPSARYAGPKHLLDYEQNIMEAVAPQDQRLLRMHIYGKVVRNAPFARCRGDGAGETSA